VLARALPLFGAALSRGGQQRRGLEETQRGEALLGRIAEAAATPSNRSHHAASLTMLGIRLNENRSYAQALEYFRRSCAIYEQLEAGKKGRHRWLLAIALQNVGTQLRYLDKPHDGAEALKRAAGIFRDHSADTQAALVEQRLFGLEELIKCQLQDEDGAGALSSAREYQEVLGRLAPTIPTLYALVPRCHRALSDCLAAVQSHDEALIEAQQAVTDCEAFAEHIAAPYHAGEVGSSLYILAQRLMEQDKPRGSHTLLLQALASFNQLEPRALRRFLRDSDDACRICRKLSSNLGIDAESFEILLAAEQRLTEARTNES
jgi:tetratricopeptide (TPR) repeat protein